MTIVESLIRELDTIIDKQGWGLPARLYLVFADDVGGLRLSETPQFSTVAAILRPPEAVRTVSMALAGQTPRHPDTYGWLVVSESWSVVRENVTDAEHREFERLARQGDLANAPGSERSRTLILVSYAGDMAIIVRTQDGVVACLVDGDGSTHVTGALPEAMRLLVAQGTRQ